MRFKQQVFKDLEHLRREHTPLLDLLRKQIGDENFSILIGAKNTTVKRILKEREDADSWGPLKQTEYLEKAVHQYTTPQERLREWVCDYAKAFRSVRAELKKEVEFNSLKTAGQRSCALAKKNFDSFASGSWRSDSVEFTNDMSIPPGHHRQEGNSHKINIGATYFFSAKKIGSVIVDSNFIYDIRNIRKDGDLILADVMTLTQHKRSGSGYAIRSNCMFVARHQGMQISALSDKSAVQAARTCNSRVVKAIDAKMAGKGG